MPVLITEQYENEFAEYLELCCGKKSARISKWKSGTVCVVCKNASHSVWRGSGRMFDSFEQAERAYKSPEMKEMINFAADQLRELRQIAEIFFN